MEVRSNELVTQSQYRPCKAFPGEVADYYCMQCFEPCSALALLVGPHTNHPRRRLVEALEVTPAELMRDGTEFRCAVGTLAKAVAAHGGATAAAERAVVEELLDIDAQIGALQRRRRDIEARAREDDRRRADQERGLAARGDELGALGQRYLRAIAVLRPYYDASFAAGDPMPRRAFESSLEELARTERGLLHDLAMLAEEVTRVLTSSAGACAPSSAQPSPQQARHAAAHTPPPPPPPPLQQQQHQERHQEAEQSAPTARTPPLPSLDVASGGASTPPQQWRRCHAASSEEEIRESIAAVQQQLAARSAAAGSDGCVRTPASAPMRHWAAPLDHHPPTAVAAAGGGAGCCSAQAAVAMDSARGAADRDALLHHVLTNQEMRIRAAAPAPAPASQPRPRPHYHVAATAGADTSGITEDEEILARVLRAKAIDPSSSSSSSASSCEAQGRGGSGASGISCGPQPRSSTKEYRCRDEGDAGEAQYGQAPPSGTTSVNLSRLTSASGRAATTSGGTGVTATTVDPRDTSKLSARLMKQFRRVRQCLRDATVGRQPKLARSLLRTVNELRAEARAYHIDEIEAAVGVDPELLDLLQDAPR